MNGWQQLNRIDLEILDGISRERQGERTRMAHNEYLLHGDGAARNSAAARLAALVLGASLLAAVIIALALAASGGSGSLVLLGA